MRGDPGWKAGLLSFDILPLHWTGLVSGHDFSRADNNGCIKGFSPCTPPLREASASPPSGTQVPRGLFAGSLSLRCNASGQVLMAAELYRVGIK